MVKTPTHPDAGEDTDVRDRGPSTGSSRWQKVVGTIGLAVLLGVGVGISRAASGEHGPGGDTPSPAVPVDGDQTPRGEAPHDPSNFDHSGQ